MKKLLPLFIFLAILLTPLYPVYAVDSTDSGATRPLKTAKERLDQQKMMKMTTKVDNIASREAQLKLKKDQLKAKLDTFKDQRKANVVERINDNLARINKNRTDQMGARLDRLSNILTRAETRIQQSTLTETDKLKVNESIATASASITAAKAAVDVQAAKDYTIKVTTESAVKADSMIARDTLKNDLDATHEQVKAARIDVSDVIMQFKLLKGATNGQ